MHVWGSEREIVLILNKLDNWNKNIILVVKINYLN